MVFNAPPMLMCNGEMGKEVEVLELWDVECLCIALPSVGAASGRAHVVDAAF